MYILNKKEFKVYAKKNIYRYIINKLCGLYRYRKLNPSSFLYFCELLSILFNFKYLKRLYVPQIEFFITSRCTLNCKNCSNYIPYIKKKLTYDLTFSQFKINLDNLLYNLYKLNSLILVGGEPLLNKDFINMLEYSLKNQKVENVYFFTNGTITFTNELLCLLKKYKHKVCVYVSNYTSNIELKPVLKTNQILETLKENNIKYIFNKKQIWVKQEEISSFHRSYIEDSNIYLCCNVPSVSVVLGKMHLCPKATAALLLNKLDFKYFDFIDLDKIVSKEEILRFYSQEYFSICGYCSGPNAPKVLIKPAEQMKECN